MIGIQKEKRNGSIGNPALELNRASCIKSNSSGVGKPAAWISYWSDPGLL